MFELAAKRRLVIVWIHGGRKSRYADIIFRGSAAEYDPDYLLDQEIVLVTLQYRFSH